jgi:antitoxin Phd
MEIKIESLIPFDTLIEDHEYVFSLVEKNGEVLLLKNNRPAYIITKYNSQNEIQKTPIITRNKAYTLHMAMKMVLAEEDDHTMHASDLADVIYERKLYLQKDGKKAHYTQIRARCGHYPEYFEVLPGNNIKLRKE